MEDANLSEIKETIRKYEEAFNLGQKTKLVTKEDVIELLHLGLIGADSERHVELTRKLMLDIGVKLTSLKNEQQIKAVYKCLNLPAAEKFKALFEPFFDTLPVDSEDFLRESGGYYDACDLGDAVDIDRFQLDPVKVDEAANELVLLFGVHGFVTLIKLCQALKVSSHSKAITHMTNERDELTIEDVLEPGITDMKVFDFKRIEKLASGITGRSRHLQNLNKVLKTETAYRELAKVDSDILGELKALKESFPNFIEVIDYYIGQVSLALLDENRVFAAKPILLVGGAGSGKTTFAMTLANVIGTVFKSINLGSTTAGFVISGSSHQWEGGSSGIVLTCLRDEEYANPIILVDEIDKTGGDRRYDPIASLLTLLEPQTAKIFIDESIEEKIDASKVVWISTANDLDKLSEPIKSRMKIFHIEKVSVEAAKKIIKSIWASMREEESWGSRFKENLDDDVLKILSDKSAREIKRELNMICGNIARRAVETGLGRGELLQITMFNMRGKQYEEVIVCH